jgi:hypothetical protein
MGRCLAKDGDAIDGKIIARVLPNSLAVSGKHALTGWEAEYWTYADEQRAGATPHRGVFNDNRFVAELDAGKASEPGNATAEADFRWDEERETLALKPGILAPPPAAPNYTYMPVPAVPAAVPPAVVAKPCTPQSQGPSAKIHPPKKPSAWACKTLGICVDDKPLDVSAGNGCQPVSGAGQPAK